jgi:23S rRNA (cytosine1962-C5)-methyltransferase
MSALPVRVHTRRGPHPWIFSNEILSPPVSSLPAGGAVQVEDERGRKLGFGYSNPHSLISIRLTGAENPDSPDFFIRRLSRALVLRQSTLPGRVAGRLCAGEADGLPGVIIDRYGLPGEAPVLSVQITSLGMEKRKEALKEALLEVVKPRAIVLRNDVSLRELEGLPLEKGLWAGEQSRAEFLENGACFEVDLLEGQKTGFFFDQADNRAFLAARAKGRTVLDVFAYVGALAVEAMLAGAASATTIDSSATAVASTQANAARNGVQVESLMGDARDMLENLERSFDMVSVDPPAFAKSRKQAGAALAGYRTINQLALKKVKPGSLFFTSSCSHHIQPERFEETILEAAHRAGRALLLIRRGGQAPDHPILPGVPETEYLKHLVFAVR